MAIDVACLLKFVPISGFCFCGRNDHKTKTIHLLPSPIPSSHVTLLNYPPPPVSHPIFTCDTAYRMLAYTTYLLTERGLKLVCRGTYLGLENALEQIF